MVVHSHPYLDARSSPQIASTRNHSSTRFWASRHIHTLPHLSTLAHKVLGTQTMDGLPRFRQSLGDHDFLWAVRHYSGHPQNWEPTHTLGHPKPTIFGHPHIIVEAHELLWVAMRYYGRPREVMDAHICYMGIQRVSFCAPTCYRWAHTLFAWAHTRFHGRTWLYSLDNHTQHYAHPPALYRTSTILCGYQSRLPGRPRKNWSLMRFVGLPRELSWAPTCCVVDVYVTHVGTHAHTRHALWACMTAYGHE